MGELKQRGRIWWFRYYRDGKRFEVFRPGPPAAIGSSINRELSILRKRPSGEPLAQR